MVEPPLQLYRIGVEPYGKSVQIGKVLIDDQQKTYGDGHGRDDFPSAGQSP